MNIDDKIFINKLEVTRGGQKFILINSNEMFCHMCNHEIAHEKFVDEIWDMSPTLGLPEYNGESYKYSTDQKFQPLVYMYYSDNDVPCYIVSQEFILYNKLVCDIQNNKIIAYYKSDENGKRNDIIIIDNDCFYIRTSYLKKFLKTINKPLLYKIEKNIANNENVETLINELKKTGINPTNNYPYLNYRYILAID